MQEIYPIKIKKSIATGKKAAKNFSVLDKYNMTVRTGLVIDTCEEIRPVNEKAFCYPVFRLGE